MRSREEIELKLNHYITLERGSMYGSRTDAMANALKWVLSDPEKKPTRCCDCGHELGDYQMCIGVNMYRCFDCVYPQKPIELLERIARLAAKIKEVTEAVNKLRRKDEMLE